MRAFNGVVLVKAIKYNSCEMDRLCSSYHQRIATGFQRGQADAKYHNSRKRVVVDEAAALSVPVASVEGQVRVGVARKEDRAEVDLKGDGLHPAVNADVPLRFEGHTDTFVRGKHPPATTFTTWLLISLLIHSFISFQKREFLLTGKAAVKAGVTVVPIELCCDRRGLTKQ